MAQDFKFGFSPHGPPADGDTNMAVMITLVTMRVNAAYLL